MILNRQQQEVVDHKSGPLLVLACPGSGKTRCITERIISLIRKGDKPSSILGVTFTNKAANEMLERVEAKGGHGILISTFHSLGVKILRRCGHIIGYKRNFTICDSSAQHTLFRRIVKNQGKDTKDAKYNHKRLVGIIEDKKNQLMSDEAFEFNLEPDMIEIFREYQKTLKMSNSMDFGDLIYNVIKLFEKEPKIQQAYSTRFKHILVDEMQDTNKAQLEMVKRLSSVHNNIVVVGDSCQSIYGWRNACIDNILKFGDHFDNTKTIFLGKNYRSTPEILEVAEKLINKNRNQIAIKLEATRESNKSVHVLKHISPEEETEEIANIIQSHNYDGVSYKDIAILCRTNALTRLFEECFRRRSIPYVLVGAFGFYDRKEVKTAMAFMKFLANSEDAIAFNDIINVPSRGVGPATIIKILEYADKNKMPFVEVCRNIENVKKINKKAKNAISHFIKAMDDYDNNSPCSSLIDIFENCGFIEHLRYTDKLKQEHREENVQELLRAFSHYCSRKPNPTIDKYLQEIMLLTNADKEVSTESVSLMTCHAAKGLEYEVVFIPGMEEMIFPHKRSLADGTLEEERRVCYVAVTRAKDFLYLSHAGVRNVNNAPSGTMPSRFLEDMGLITIDWNDIYD
jgi:DNA helicase-2/ATP-dependent DNA helicase PcrA